MSAFNKSTTLINSFNCNFYGENSDILITGTAKNCKFYNVKSIKGMLDNCSIYTNKNILENVSGYFDWKSGRISSNDLENNQPNTIIIPKKK